MTMYKHSDAFICWSGGIGTLEEILEIITWSELDMIGKPIFILNINRYWNKLENWINQIISQSFASKDLLERFTIYDHIEPLISGLTTSLRIESKE